VNDIASLSHTKQECKYRIVFTQKYRKRNCMGERGQVLALDSAATPNK
jgi:REP element-mobilizing transposase RayT